MKSKAGKEPEVGSKKRKEVGNGIALVSMFPKQQAVNDLNQSREAYNTQLQKGKVLFQKGKELFQKGKENLVVQEVMRSFSVFCTEKK
jgi:hypothetical protein